MNSFGFVDPEEPKHFIFTPPTITVRKRLGDPHEVTLEVTVYSSRHSYQTHVRVGCVNRNTGEACRDELRKADTNIPTPTSKNYYLT